jgi:hypothetical protein
VCWLAVNTSKTVLAFFDQLGEERCKQIELITADMAAWISGRIAERAPQAVRCVDPFHVVMLATDALDDVRRKVWNEARRQGNLELARDLKGARFAVWKNPENLADRQAAKLASIQQTNARLYRAYLLKEQLRQIYRLPAAAAERLLDRWLARARRCRLPSFVKPARTITEQRDGILAAVQHGLSSTCRRASETEARGDELPRLVLPRLVHAELAQVLEVLLAPGRPLHREEMLEPADEQRPAAEVQGDRLACERRIRRVLVDPSDPLHDVERPQARLESEVRPLLQLLGIERVIRELLGCEVADPDVLRLELT